jgi:hypothetical protein
MRRSALTAALVAAALQAMPAGAATTPITVDPEVGTPDIAFHVELRAIYPTRQIRDRYWFVVHGPGGHSCEGAVTERVGVTPPGRAKTVSVDLPGVRVVSKDAVEPEPWCAGTFSGRVEFRDYQPRRHRTVVHRIGTFTFTVQESQ